MVDRHRDASEVGRQQGYWNREQVAEESTATQDEEQAEGPSRDETGMATLNVEEASSTGRAEAACDGDRATPNQRETCMQVERAPLA